MYALGKKTSRRNYLGDGILVQREWFYYGTHSVSNLFANTSGRLAGSESCNYCVERRKGIP